MRTHSQTIAGDLVEGMNAPGANVIDTGMIDTPQMYFAIHPLGTCGGVQETAFHNPAQYNGFKISGRGAKPVGVDTGLRDIKHIATALPHTKGRVTGLVKKRDLTNDSYQNTVIYRRSYGPISLFKMGHHEHFTIEFSSHFAYNESNP